MRVIAGEARGRRLEALPGTEVTPADGAVDVSNEPDISITVRDPQVEGQPYTVPAAMAKMTCTNVAMEVTTEAVQMLGGNGYMKEYHVERMMRDAKITQIYEGTNEIQKLVISNNLFR